MILPGIIFFDWIPDDVFEEMKLVLRIAAVQGCNRRVRPLRKSFKHVEWAFKRPGPCFILRWQREGWPNARLTRNLCAHLETSVGSLESRHAKFCRRRRFQR